MGMRIFNHNKQYTCTEVFRLIALQNVQLEIEKAVDAIENGYFNGRRQRNYSSDQLSAVGKLIEEFISNLVEQEKQK